jgi:flagellar protein FlbD
MITLTRLDGREVVVNADHILLIERTPDTMLQLTNGAHLTVREKAPEVIDKVGAWRRSIVRPVVAEAPSDLDSVKIGSGAS